MNVRFEPDLRADGLPFRKIVNAGPVGGGEAFLLIGENTTILFDAGFGCGGDLLVRNIEECLQGRELNDIFLSHSHYDHAPGSAWCTARWPSCRVVAGRKTRSVFARPGAIATMRRLDAEASKMFGLKAETDRFGELRVDLAPADGEAFRSGSLDVVLMELPGHTNCSVGYWFPACGLLLAGESTGVAVPGSDMVVSALLTGFEAGMSSIRRCMQLPIRHMFIPHCGLLHGDVCMAFLENGLRCNEQLRERLIGAWRQGKDREQLRQILKSVFYRGRAAEIQPEAAFDENSGYIVDTVIREYTEASTR